VTVDGSDFPKTLMSELQLMSGSHLLVGGAQNPDNITHSIMRNNFYGTIDKVGGHTALLWCFIVALFMLLRHIVLISLLELPVCPIE